MAGLSGGTYEDTASVLGHRSSTTAGVRIGNGQVGIFTYRVGTGPITATARGGYSPPSITSAGKDLDYQRFAPSRATTYSLDREAIRSWTGGRIWTGAPSDSSISADGNSRLPGTCST